MDALEELLELVNRNHRLDAWKDINPMYAKTFRLAITSRMEFDAKEFDRILIRYGVHHWIGESWEPWYALAVEHGHPTAVLAIERHLGRKPAFLKGERIVVDKFYQWKGQTCRCTSIDDRAGVVRLKRDEVDWKGGDDGAGNYRRFPGTLYTISIQELEELRAAELAAEKTARKRARDSKIADPVALLPFGRHLDEEIRKHAKGGRVLGAHPEDDYHLKQCLPSTFTDYREYWDACPSGYSLAAYLQWIGCTKTQVDGSAEEIRRKYTWKKVEQAIFRFVRECRGLPLRDPIEADHEEV